jgi:hypothetical protein
VIKQNSGPKPRVLLSKRPKWEDEVAAALKKPRPAEGWPKPAVKKRAPKK